jgi:predicted RNA polymerase sigma factor
VAPSPTHRAIEAVWRIESSRLIASLARMVRDVGLAEDLAQDALVVALERWPASGVPDNPGAWLMATAKHRAIDLARRSANLEHKHEQIARDMGVRMAMDGSDVGAEIGDDLLSLIFTC